MAIPEQFTGFAALSQESWKCLTKIKFTPKSFEEFDVDIQVQYCGVCGSDCHTMSGGWGATLYPSIVGHEIVGLVKRVGPAVVEVKVGDIVGVGPNVWSCGKCSSCVRDSEQYCPDLVETYNFRYKDGSRSWGGYADYVRVHERFVFQVPAELSPAAVAPLFCAGLTVYSPLRRHNVGPGTRVGVVGVGGLGHYAVMFASAMGARVTAITHSPRKISDAQAMGAAESLMTGQPGWADDAARSLDLIICTSFDKSMALDKYISLLDVGGTMVYVGIPEGDLPALPPTLMIGNNAALRGSNTGSKKEVLDMLDFVVQKKIKSWVEEIPMSQCSDALERQLAGESRYRFVLVRDWEA